jgi:hypothetical protein
VNDVNFTFTNTPLAGKLNIDMSGGSNYMAQAWNTSTGAATGWASNTVKGTYGTQGGNNYTGPGQVLNGGGNIDGGMFDKNSGMYANIFTPINTGVGINIGNTSIAKGFATVDRVWSTTNSSEYFNSNLKATVTENTSRSWSSVQALFNSATPAIPMSVDGVKASTSTSNTTSIWFDGSDPR